MDGAGKNDDIRFFNFFVVKTDEAVFSFIVADVVYAALAASQASSLDVDIAQIDDLNIPAKVTGKGLNHGVDIACRMLSVLHHQNPFACSIHVGRWPVPVDR